MRTVRLAGEQPAPSTGTLPLTPEALLVPAGSSSTPARASAADVTAARQQIGERVRTARMAVHLTQTDLAGPDYSKSYISAVERGKLTPSFQALGVLAERLGVTRSFLLGEDLPQPLLAQEAPGEDQQQVAREALEALLREECYEEALALCARCGHNDWSSEVRAAYAQWFAAQGRFGDAYQQMEQALKEQTPRPLDAPAARD